MLTRLALFGKSILHLYSRGLVRREYQKQAFRRFNERPVEFAFLFRHLMRLYPCTVLDVGTGTTALPHLMRNCGFLVTAIDNIHDYWPNGMINRHYHVIDDDITDTRLSATFDFISCVSVLEHIEKADQAVASMFRLLNPGGHLLLTFPYTDGSYVRNVYALPGSAYGQDVSYIAQSFSHAELDRWLEQNQAEIVEQEFWQCWDSDYWTVGRQVIPPRQVTRDDRHQLTCLLLRRTPVVPSPKTQD